MKKGVLLIFLIVIPISYGLLIDESCRYNSFERDASALNCQECGAYWADGRCCDDLGENFCIANEGSCVNGISHNNHCFDNVRNCDESSIDCGGNDCKDCCSLSNPDQVCPLGCGYDGDIDCCAETSDEILPWSSAYKCCNAGDVWCSGAEGTSCNYGAFSADRCNDNVRNCDEEGIDCGGSCKPCGPVNDGYCSYVDLMFYKQNDPDCCLVIGGNFQEGKCCFANGDDWCNNGGGSCVGGVYSPDHCFDGVRNDFCGDYTSVSKTKTNAGDVNVLSSLEFVAEIGVDCGGECSATCFDRKQKGGSCASPYDCASGLYCSGEERYWFENGESVVVTPGACCPFDTGWNGTCCSTDVDGLSVCV